MPTRETGDSGSCSGLDPFEDTESTEASLSIPSPRFCCSGLDPFEDTERCALRLARAGINARCSGLDPVEDTEGSRARTGALRSSTRLQRPRSV